MRELALGSNPDSCTYWLCVRGTYPLCALVFQIWEMVMVIVIPNRVIKL